MLEQDSPTGNRGLNAGITRVFDAGGQTWRMSIFPGGVSIENADRTIGSTGLDQRSALVGVLGIVGARRVREIFRSEDAQQDVPAHDGGLTSSVGALWPPERASFERIKGIYTQGIIRDRKGLDEIVNQVNKAQAIFNGEVNRISLRAVVDVDYLREVAEDIQAHSIVEAAIPLSGTQPAFEDTVLVYFGLNHSTRQPIQTEIVKYLDNLREASSHRVLTPQEIRKRVEREGYDIRILSKEAVTEDRIDQVALLYRRFGWAREEVSTILNNPNNFIGIAVKDDMIVSAGIAEMARIPIGYNGLRIAEVTEAATLDEHARNGLYTAVSSGLLEELSRRSKEGQILGGEIDLVYGECNGNALGVLKTAHVQGRRFARNEGGNFGLPDSGVLFQHVPIAGLPKGTEYNDLFPAFMVRSELYGRYAQ